MSTIYCDKSLLPSRREEDFYPTDRATVQTALLAYRQHLQMEPDHSPRSPRQALDPGAGSGVWGEVAKTLFPTLAVTGVEKRSVWPHPSYQWWVEKDFLDPVDRVHPLYDLVLGNPPYQHAEAFIRRALLWTKDGGHVLFLLRLAFLEGVGRRDGLFAQHPLRRVWICSKRPSFQLNGKSGPTAYAVYLWQKGYQGQTTIDYLRDQ